MEKVLLGIPTYKTVSSVAFAHQMAILTEGITSGLVKRLEIEVDLYVTLARNKICRKALEQWEEGNISHVLFLDDDVLMPSGGIVQLLSRKLPIVGGLYFSKDLQPLAYNLSSGNFVDSVPNEGLLKVEGTGGGCLLIECSVLQKMKEEFKDNWWFQNTIELNSKGEEKYLGEDVFFFRRLKKIGIPLYIDCNVQCEHAGTGVTSFASYNLIRNIPGAATATNISPDAHTQGDVGI